MITEQEYTDEEYAAEMQRVRNAIESITESQLDAFLKSGDAAKRRRHADSYRYKGYHTFRLSVRTPNLSNKPKNCNEPTQGDSTEYERMRELVKLHMTSAMRSLVDFIPLGHDDNIGRGVIVGYDEHSRSYFESLSISLAVRQTIKERYEILHPQRTLAVTVAGAKDVADFGSVSCYAWSWPAHHLVRNAN